MPQKGNTRSRTGCLVCRKRHVRCDEQRPSCQNCLSTERSCIYPHMVVPLRDRRALQKNGVPPGQQAPWALMSTSAPSLTGPTLMARRAIDPFDTLPIRMPFKSQELYHYFYQCGSAFAVAPEDPKDDCMALTTLDEHALRSTILIAAIHYSWNAGDLKAYDSAFLFHKVESIHLINRWLQNPSSGMFVACMRQILTICLAESCLGNIPAAETHINGVMAILSSREQSKGSWGSPSDIELELTDRYLLLTSCFIIFLKSRLQDFRSFRASQGIDASANDDSSVEALKLMRLWHGVEKGGLDTRLKAMRMFPSFFSAPPRSNRPRDIDIRPVVDCIRDVTHAVNRFRASPTAVNCDLIWNEGGATRLMLALVNAHVWSFGKHERSRPSTHKQSAQQAPRSSWVGIVAAMELYMHSVLNIVNAGEPIECRLLYRVLMMMKQDIEQTRGDLDRIENSQSRALWFWKVFTGALALARSKDDHLKQASACSCEADLDVLHEWFCGCIRTFTTVTGISNWIDTMSTLETIAWPAFMFYPEKGYAEELLGLGDLTS